MYDITIKAFSAEIKFYENGLLVLCGTGYPDDHAANITCKKKGKY